MGPNPTVWVKRSEKADLATYHKRAVSSAMMNTPNGSAFAARFGPARPFVACCLRMQLRALDRFVDSLFRSSERKTDEVRIIRRLSLEYLTVSRVMSR